jgi:transcriptional regulator of acetoin/glycerol metabolism
MHRPAARLDAEARNTLLAHRGPGNVRELRHVLERAAVLSDEGVIERRRLSLHAKPIAAASPTDLSAIERQTIDTVLRETDGNKSKTRGAWASRARSCTSGSAATASRIRRRHSIAP